MGEHLTDAELAREIGVDKSSVSQWKTGGLPKTLGNVLRIINSQARPAAVAPSPVPPPESGTAPALEPVPDRRIAEALAVLADEYEALNPRGRESLLMRFWAAYPDLRERRSLGQGRRLARLAGDRGGPARGLGVTGG